MELIILFILSLYFLEHLIFFIGLQKNLKLPPPAGYVQSVSVIVAAKNEEACIGECIKSLLKLDYPQDKLQIVLVNDRSTDRTGEIMCDYTEKHKVLKYIEIKELKGKLKGKTNALAYAIKQSTGELIFTTDADIEVKSSWVKEMVKYYNDNTGLVSSYSIIKPRSFFWGIQAFDWIYLLTIGSGADGINNQISCLGNNMSYKRKAYDEIGGYENIKFSVTEDFMLLQTIKNKTKWKTRFPVNFDTVNYTLACKNIKELYGQKKRWTKGGLDAKTAGILVGVMAWLSGAVILSGWLISFKYYLIFLASKIIIDLLFTLPVLLRFKEYSTLLYIVFFEFYFAVYVFLMPFILIIDGNVVWKEQKL
ncbi:MAG: glycosyltransferase [Ignavibacteriae bacterium]|nr:MAG: glycosyltransferase [Ignavibacteriota bacterium]